MSKKKRFFFVTTIVLLGLFTILVVGELFLRIKLYRVKTSYHLDNGLIQYDKYLGWELSPNWRGGHKHYDFDVSYSTNPAGFRNDFKIKKHRTGLRYAFVGDSFTFSLGVNDDETFIQRLNSQETEGNTYLNFGVPGFSTDQEYLLVRDRVFDFYPDVILLVVYLGNDLFDNERPFPLQANQGKPYFELQQDGLRLRNTPVPLTEKPEDQAGDDLTSVVMGGNYNAHGFITQCLDRLALFRLLKFKLFETTETSVQFDDRFDYTVDLFTAIVDGMCELCIQKKTKLSLLLMPGKSFVERPGSLSAQFQDYFRKKIVANGKRLNVTVIDLANQLRELYHKGPVDNWFHPNEGHLTADGHRVVADIISPLIRKKTINGYFLTP